MFIHTLFTVGVCLNSMNFRNKWSKVDLRILNSTQFWKWNLSKLIFAPYFTWELTFPMRNDDMHKNTLNPSRIQEIILDRQNLSLDKTIYQSKKTVRPQKSTKSTKKWIGYESFYFHLKVEWCHFIKSFHLWFLCLFVAT